MYLLPPPKIDDSTSKLSDRVKSFIKTKKGRYWVAIGLDLVAMFLIFKMGGQPVKSLISPLVSSLTSMYSVTVNRSTDETFAFAPGHASNKYKYIDFENLNYLAIFDVPLTSEGAIDTDTIGYTEFKSPETVELIEQSKFFKTKALVTLSALNNKTVDSILNDAGAQNQLIEQTIQEVKDSNLDGVAIDFEYKGNVSKQTQEKYTTFISNLTARMHAELPSSLVGVCVLSSANSEDSLYDLEGLSKSADKVFAIADNIALPEIKNSVVSSPVYGYKEDSYWEKISRSLSVLAKDTSSKKLVMERAWYGNGDRYPLYVPNSKPPVQEELEPAHVFLDSEAVERLASQVPSKSRASAKKNIPLIGKALQDEGILDSNVLAYALATIEHETAETFEPIDEFSGRYSARRLGYEGGTNYFGRGFIQLTHLRNYRMMGERIGMGDKLAENPSLASDPAVAAKILAAFFKDNNIANLASRGQFVAARRPVNPDRHGWAIADMAMKYGL